MVYQPSSGFLLPKLPLQKHYSDNISLLVWENNSVHTFPGDISPKENCQAQLGLELTYNYVTDTFFFFLWYIATDFKYLHRIILCLSTFTITERSFFG